MTFMLFAEGARGRGEEDGQGTEEKCGISIDWNNRLLCPPCVLPVPLSTCPTPSPSLAAYNRRRNKTGLLVCRRQTSAGGVQPDELFPSICPPASALGGLCCLSVRRESVAGATCGGSRDPQRPQRCLLLDLWGLLRRRLQHGRAGLSRIGPRRPGERRRAVGRFDLLLHDDRRDAITKWATSPAPSNQYTSACKLFLAHRDWLLSVEFPPTASNRKTTRG